MIAFALGRLGYALAVMLGVATVAFGLLHLAGDPLAGLVPPGAAPEDQAALRARYGLDRSLPAQYATFLGRAARGDLGDSWSQREPAFAAVLDRLPATLALTGAAVGLALAVGVPLGIAAGLRPRGPAAAVAAVVALLGQAVPGFWLGTLLILLFAVRLGWLPATGLDSWRSLVLPAATLAVYPAATVVRLLRASLTGTLRLDHIRTARGKGLPPGVVLRRHLLPVALTPTLAYVGLQVGFLLGGAVVVEAVFAYPGVGQLALGAAVDRDLPLVQAFVVVVAALVVAANLAVDLTAAWLDPRLRDVAVRRDPALAGGA
jgi:ABC-type dipeptide/oligopeptide/nickel transport system permease component